VGKLIFIVFIVFLISCTKPDIKYIYEVETVKVPVYKSPIDNMSIVEKPQIEYFAFSPDGKICLDEENFKILANDLLLMKNYIDKADNIFQILEKKQIDDDMAW